MKQLKRHLPEIEVDENDPFLNCKLGRKSIAPILADVVSTYGETGTVLALDGDWGTGKTTFVKMWKRYLELNGFPALYFNAWECDFVEDPLIALLGELKELRADDASFKKVASVTTKVITTGAIELGKGLVKKLTGADCDKIVDKTSDVLEEEFSKALDQYKESKASLLDFKLALQEYVAFNVKDIEHPVVFIVDELDRCNPTFAVKTLERIKHLFDIPNLVLYLPLTKSSFSMLFKATMVVQILTAMLIYVVLLTRNILFLLQTQKHSVDICSTNMNFQISLIVCRESSIHLMSQNAICS